MVPTVVERSGGLNLARGPRIISLVLDCPVMFMEHRYRLLITVGGVGGDFSKPHGQVDTGMANVVT